MPMTLKLQTETQQDLLARLQYRRVCVQQESTALYPYVSIVTYYIHSVVPDQHEGQHGTKNESVALEGVDRKTTWKRRESNTSQITHVFSKTRDEARCFQCGRIP